MVYIESYPPGVGHPGEDPLDLRVEIYRRLPPEDYLQGLQEIVLRRLYDLLGEPKTPQNKTRINCAKEMNNLLFAARLGFAGGSFSPDYEIREALGRALKGLGFERNEIGILAAIKKAAEKGDMVDYIPPWAKERVEKRREKDVKYARKLDFLTQNLIRKGKEPHEAQKEVMKSEALDLIYVAFNPNPPWSRRRLRVENDIWREKDQPDEHMEERLAFLARQREVFAAGEDEMTQEPLAPAKTLTFRTQVISIAVRLEELSKRTG